jgi:hypothetical protein
MATTTQKQERRIIKKVTISQRRRRKGCPKKEWKRAREVKPILRYMGREDVFLVEKGGRTMQTTP